MAVMAFVGKAGGALWLPCMLPNVLFCDLVEEVLQVFLALAEYSVGRGYTDAPCGRLPWWRDLHGFCNDLCWIIVSQPKDHGVDGFMKRMGFICCYTLK